MTVMVTGASGLIGRSLVPVLVGRDEVRACVSRPEAAEALRDMGAPVWADDLAAVLAAADDREGDLAGTWGLEGPDVITPLGLGERLAPGGSPPLALTPSQAAERLTSALGVPVSLTANEHFAAPSRADAPDAAAEFGVGLTPLETGLRLAMERAAAAGR